ncbi:MAG: hypothetical protein HKN36_07595 [Hellea sp.]|nr:hypothetical protein [Hellea sp.]
MSRKVLYVIGAIAVLTGIFIFVRPHHFYDMVPGLDLMGPFSIHFIRDVGLAYIASGAVMVWGAHHYSRPAAISGALWPFLHALFHVQIWAYRGFPFDEIFFVNLIGVILVAFVGLWAALRLRAA